MTATIYGIASCDTIKKAKLWLTNHKIEFQFHDYKKLGIEESKLKAWINMFGWEQLINKRGTTWRQLTDETKSSMNNSLAIQTILQNQSIIKRPILETERETIIGFNINKYQQLL